MQRGDTSRQRARARTLQKELVAGTAAAADQKEGRNVVAEAVDANELGVGSGELTVLSHLRCAPCPNATSHRGLMLSASS